MSLLVLSLQVQHDRIMNFAPSVGLENFHFFVIDLSSWCARIHFMGCKGILKGGVQYAYSFN